MEIPKKVIKYKNSKVVIYSFLVDMTEEEKMRWFEEEWSKNNPLLKEIAKNAIECYKNRSN